MLTGRSLGALASVAAGLFGAGCGPIAHIPATPITVPGALADTDSVARLARTLAPVLYLQADEWFRLERVVAVVHPERRIIAYHLLWRDDVHGAWLPFTIPTDQEIGWVGYDERGEVTELWSYWHRSVLHTEWRGRPEIAFDVQWGKHGTMPRGTRRHTLPFDRSLGVFYVLTWLGLPDIWLSRAQRDGPWCFCNGFARYREFSRALPLAGRIDVVVKSADPSEALRRVFGARYSRKINWPEQTPTVP